MQGLGKTFVLLGLVLALFGALIWLLADRLHWLGRLPGDLRIGDSVFIPITTCLLISAVLTLALNLLARLFGR